MISIIIIVMLIGFFIVPIIGFYIGIMKVVSDDNNEWQKQNRGANIIRGGR